MSKHKFFLEKMLDIQFGVAKVNKYASRESGDTVEIVERPNNVGGFSAVMADGQGSGRAAKTLSNLVTNRVIWLLKDGVRDSVVARAASDYLLAYRYGQVSATLNIISADFVTRTLVMTRNNPVASFVALLPQPANERTELDIKVLDEPSVPIGLYPLTKPIVHEYPLEAGLVAVSCTDGIFDAGQRYNQRLDVRSTLVELLTRQQAEGVLSAQTLADALLAIAQNRDKQRPSDDMCVLVMTVGPSQVSDELPAPRRFSLHTTLQ